jgi:outer membrane lipoprotein-sorting protein
MIATTRTVSLLRRCLAAAAFAVAAAMVMPSLPVAKAASAAPADKAASTPTAEQIVENYIAARGGLKKLKGIQSLRQKAYVNAGAGRDGVAVRELKKPGKIRFEFTVQGKTAVYLSNGKQGWQVSTLEGDLTPQPLPEDVLMDATEQADIEGPLVDWKAKGHRLELVGRETVDGIDAYKLKLDMKSGGSRYEYIDAKTWYQVRSDSTRKSRTGTVKMQTKFADFKKASGIVFPRKVEVQAENRPNKLRLLIDQVEVNPKLPDARFELSPSGKN